MTRRKDPAWIGVADRAFAAGLCLFPKSLQIRHGEEMRQVFRDRCREVAAGKRSGWQWFGLELGPDLVGSAIRAHLSVDATGPNSRVFVGLLVLAMSFVAWATQTKWSDYIPPAIRAVKQQVWLARAAWHFRSVDAFAREAVADLEAQGTPEALASAAMLLAARHDQEMMWRIQAAFHRQDGMAKMRAQDAVDATMLANRVLTKQATIPVLSIATHACALSPGCDIDAALQQLVSRDAGNATTWILAFSRASRRGDEAGMQSAIEGVARSRYATWHLATMQKALFGHVLTTSPDSAASFTIASRYWLWIHYANTDDMEHDLLQQCSLDPATSGWPGSAPAQPRWIDLHPDARPACLHLATVLTTSTDTYLAQWGWRQLRNAGPDPTPQRLAARRDAAWIYRKSWGIGHESDQQRKVSIPWTAAEWRSWNAAWAPGDGEAPAVRRWLLARGLPARAPPEFELRDPTGLIYQ